MTFSYLLGSPFSAFHALMSVLLAYWIYLDAKERGSDSSLLWAIGCTVFQPLVVGYLLYRSEIGGRTEPAGPTERAVGAFVVGHVVAVQLWFVLRSVGVFPQFVDDFAVELLYYALLFAVGAVPGYWLVWRRGWARLRRAFGWIQESEVAAR
ncbi:hypothetical protein [Halopelagius fulvigenes]|uniref:DUF4281 domain-containing protein n=1 Tax=Halopelagius fulvigenes TaxID=1198324 RepID=A0ABD5U2L6_9EURY